MTGKELFEKQAAEEAAAEAALRRWIAEEVTSALAAKPAEIVGTSLRALSPRYEYRTTTSENQHPGAEWRLSGFGVSPNGALYVWERVSYAEEKDDFAPVDNG